MEEKKKKAIIYLIWGAVLFIPGLLVCQLVEGKEDKVFFMLIGTIVTAVGFYMLIYGIRTVIDIRKDKKWMSEINARNAQYGLGQYSADNIQRSNSYYNGTPPMQGQYYNGAPPMQGQYYNGYPPVQGQYDSGVSQRVYPSEKKKENEEMK